jgi:small-conductance mechanosensitive channel
MSINNTPDDQRPIYEAFQGSNTRTGMNPIEQLFTGGKQNQVNREKRRRWRPPKYNVIDHDWEQESRLLESKEDEEREDPNYRERAKKKLPRIVFAIVVLLILTNVTVLTIRVVRFYLELPTLTINDIPLINWLWLVDIISISFVILFIVFRLFFMLLKKIAFSCIGCWPVYQYLAPYEHCVHFLVWSILILSVYPHILVGLVDNGPIDNFIWGACWSIFVISILYGIRTGIIEMIEGFLYEDLDGKIRDSIMHEQLMIYVERSHLESRSSIQWNPQKLLPDRGNVVKDFKSKSLRKVTKLIDKNSLDEACKQIADQILNSFDEQERGYLLETDLLNSLDVTEIGEVLTFFDRDGDGRLCKEDLTKGTKHIFKERKELQNKMKGRRLLLDISRSLLNFFFVLIVFFVCLFNFEVDWSSVLLSIGTALLALSFGYGATLQEVFDSLYMIFFMQPFNVGDFVTVDGGDILVVERVGVLSTYFHAFDGYGVFLRNAALSHAKLANLNRGGKISFEVQFGLNWDTSSKEVYTLNKQIGDYLKNSKIWSPKYIMHVNSIEDEGQYLNVILRVRLKKDWKWQDYTRWRKVKNDLLLEIQRITDEMDIQIEPYPNYIRLMGSEDIDVTWKKKEQ